MHYFRMQHYLSHALLTLSCTTTILYQTGWHQHAFLRTDELRAVLEALAQWHAHFWVGDGTEPGAETQTLRSYYQLCHCFPVTADCVLLLPTTRFPLLAAHYPLLKTKYYLQAGLIGLVLSIGNMGNTAAANLSTGGASIHSPAAVTELAASLWPVTL